MKEAHKKWITKNISNAFGTCKESTELMQNEFPKLRSARGFYYCPVWGKRTHWWLMDGCEVVDPTASQFPSNGLGEYKEIADEDLETMVPVGVCMDCGEDIYAKDISGFCSAQCAKSYMEYIKTGGL
jgi:hypothetical protein